MPWTFQQSTGNLSRDGVFVADCYSGAGEGKNNPDMQNVPNVGPVPRGSYTITGAECNGEIPCDQCGGSASHHHGPFVLRLHPDPGDEMFGRAGFLIHGDNSTHTASQGCIVTPNRTVRENILASGDLRLQVIA